MLKLNYNRLKVNDSGSKPDLSEVEFQGAPSSQKPFQLKVNLFGQIDIPGFVTAASATGLFQPHPLLILLLMHSLQVDKLSHIQDHSQRHIHTLPTVSLTS